MTTALAHRFFLLRLSRMARLALLPGAIGAAMAVAGCSPAVLAGAPQAETEGEKLGLLESRYRDARELSQQARVTEARGAEKSLRLNSLAELRDAYRVAREHLLESLRAIDTTRLSGEDRRAHRTMVQTLESSSAGAVASTGSAAEGATPGDTGCVFDASGVAAGDGGKQRLSERIYRCYGNAARSVVFHGDTLDRLTILSRLGTTDDRSARRELFLALQPLWRSMNGDNGAASPYRALVALSSAEWKRRGSYIGAQARSLGLDPSGVEPMLVRILETWRDNTPSDGLEPWDWHYAAGEASRRLSPRIPKEALREINDRVYRELGADPGTLGIHFDLDPRPGKTPVAFTDFGAPPRRDARGWVRAEPWIFATYRTGGLDNLNELLHETGHAVHIAAIETRPAFADWPDSDTFTEALAELIALEAYEPDWQRRYLGDSAKTAVSMRARYAGIVLDVAWALLELRMHDDPTRDPNVTWTEITNTYLHILPHPELSWWAMRGQLVDLPGYMMNYALGAVIAADLRQVVRRERGNLASPNRKTYEWLSDRLYRWGLERRTQQVLEDFLGRAVTEDALLKDMKRLRGS
jgi:hypothetical protein